MSAEEVTQLQVGTGRPRPSAMMHIATETSEVVDDCENEESNAELEQKIQKMKEEIKKHRGMYEGDESSLEL